MKSLKKCTTFFFLAKQNCSNCNKWGFRYFSFFSFFFLVFRLMALTGEPMETGIVQGRSNMTGTDLCVNMYKSVPVIFELPCICGVKLDRKHVYASVHCCL
jgi:hypothetical protein